MSTDGSTSGMVTEGVYRAACRENIALAAERDGLREACKDLLAVLTEPGIADVDMWKYAKKRAEQRAEAALTPKPETSDGAVAEEPKP